MGDGLDRSEWHTRKLRDWLLAIVRFAISRDDRDRHAVLAIAEELDGLGSMPGCASFTFFRRTSAEFGRAIADLEDPGRTAVFRRLLKMIDDRRLRQTLAAAVDFGGNAVSGNERLVGSHRSELSDRVASG